MFFLLLFLKTSYAEFSYDKTTETTCNGKVCTKTLYSGYSPTFFENVIKKSSNWLKFYNVVFLEKDSNFNLELTSFNDTNFIVHLNVPLSQKNKQVPLKLCDENGCSNVSILMNVLDRDVTVGINPLKLSNITFGFNSTTIQLQENVTENLGDSYMSSVSPASNYGTATSLLTRYDGGGSKYWDIIKFNITSIPISSTITDASFCMWLFNNGLSSATEGFNTSNHLVFNNYSWEETTVTWNNKPSTGYYNATKEDDYKIFGGASKPVNTWVCWKSTQIINYAYSNSYSNLTIHLITHDVFGSPSYEYGYFYSREGTPTNITLRPYLNITYETEAGGTVYNATFNITSKGNVSSSLGTFGYARILNQLSEGYIIFFRTINLTSFFNQLSKGNVSLIRNSILIRFLNQLSKGNVSLSGLYVHGLATFERFINQLSKGTSSFIRNFALIDFFNPKSKGSATFIRNLILTRLINLGSKGDVDFLRGISLTRFFGVPSENIIQFLIEFTANLFERILNIGSKGLFNYQVYIRRWEEVSNFQVCSILKQIGSSRAYLCVKTDGTWKILIRGTS